MYTNKAQREWREENIKRACDTLGITRKQYKWFVMYGNKLHAIYEWNCNGKYPSGREITEDEYKDLTKPLYTKIEKEAKTLGLKVYFQTDPRGATIYLDTKPIPRNNYTNASCIY